MYSGDADTNPAWDTRRGSGVSRTTSIRHVALGMSIGLWFHWYFGVRHGEEFMRHHQEDVEQKASQKAA